MSWSEVRGESHWISSQVKSSRVIGRQVHLYYICGVKIKIGTTRIGTTRMGRHMYMYMYIYVYIYVYMYIREYTCVLRRWIVGVLNLRRRSRSWSRGTVMESKPFEGTFENAQWRKAKQIPAGSFLAPWGVLLEGVFDSIKITIHYC